MGLGSLRAGRQVIDDDDIDPVGRSVSQSVTQAGSLRPAVAASASSPCLESAHIQKALSGPQPRHSFAPCGHPSGKRLRLDAREEMHLLTVSNGGSARRRILFSASVFHAPGG